VPPGTEDAVTAAHQAMAAELFGRLRALNKHGLLMQDASRLLSHGPLGEKRVNHFTFFAAFPDTLEYRLLHASKELGTLPPKIDHQVSRAERAAVPPSPVADRPAGIRPTVAASRHRRAHALLHSPPFHSPVTSWTPFL